MTIVLGLDISRNFAVGFLLESAPISPLDWFNSARKKTVKRNKTEYQYHKDAVFLTNNAKGLATFKSLKPDVIILEPTGYWYSQYWVLAAEKMGCKILWMGHQQLCKHRFHYGFKNKDDDIDAFVLALTYFDDLLPSNRFLLHYNHHLISDLRLAFYERKRLLKSINQNTNQIAKFLEIEFPEIATRELCSESVAGVNPTLGHLAGVYKNRKWPKENTGLGVSRRTLSLVMETLEKQTQVKEQDLIIEAILSDREFEPYLKVFDDYGFGIATKAHLLLKVYPIHRFFVLGKSEKDHKGHDLSLRRFQAYLGLGFNYSRSGDGSHANNKVKKAWQGSTLCRSDIFAWILVNPVKINLFKPQTAIQQRLKELWTRPRSHTIREKGIIKTITLPTFKSLGKDGICRYLFILTRWLWNDLLKEIDSLEF